MTDIHESELAEQIDREVVQSDSILALALCLFAAGGIVVASLTAFLSIPG